MESTSVENRSVSAKHKIAISIVPPQEKKETYDNWGDTYDEDMWVEPIHSWHIGPLMLFDIIKADYQPDKEPVIVDAGCGTGGPGGTLRKLAIEQGMQIRMIGYDFSKSMLEQARKKGFYDDLFVGDLLHEIPIEDKSVDYAMSMGVFVDGSDHPEALEKILRHLRENGVAVITFRINTFQRMKKKYLEVIEKTGCAIVQEKIDKYYGADKALYLAIKKCGGTLSMNIDVRS